ncbi:hypothetical protein ACTFIW_001444 [Dictyostelium discoideum]
MTNVLFFICLILISINFVNSQGSPSNCTFNGVNYGSLSNGSYSALSAASNSSFEGKYRYYWNICGDAILCKFIGVSTCQLPVGSPYSPTPIGLTSLGSFSILNSTTQLKYTTNSKCFNGNLRSFVMSLTCYNSEVITTTLVMESRCIYKVEMSGKAFCRPSNGTSNGTSNATSNGISNTGSNMIATINIFIIQFLIFTYIFL